MRKKIEISAVRDRDIRMILDQHQLSEKIDKGELMCPSCSGTLTWDNLGGFVVVRGRPLLFCSHPACVDAARQEASDG